MSKYDPLTHFLGHSHASAIPMQFAEIEKLLGFSLPPSARTHRAWWSNNPDNNVMTKAWLAGGYETEQVDIEGEKLVFRSVDIAALPARVGPADAPRTRHPLYGALKGTFVIADGVDLTEPADPEWADLVEDPNWRTANL